MKTRKISVLLKEHDGEIYLSMWEDCMGDVKLTTKSSHESLMDCIEFSLNNFKKAYAANRDVMLKVGIYDETNRKSLGIFDARPEYKEDKPTGNWIGVFPRKDWWEEICKGDDIQ